MSNMKENTLVLATSADKNYAMTLAAMLKSIAVNLRPNTFASVYILYNRISAFLKNKIEKSLRNNPLDIHWMYVDDNLIGDVVLSKRITKTAYYKILLPDLLPLNIKKVIYLDSDLIVNSDLYGLWDLSMDGYHALAIPEVQADVRYLSSPKAIKLYRQLGLTPDAKYFNSGVLLIDLDKWRRDEISKKTIEYSRRNLGYINWWDQDALNVTLYGKWKEIDSRWNQLSQVHDFSSWEESPFDKKTYEVLIKQPFIVHFNTHRKPWLWGCKHPFKDLFFHYLDMTPWSGWRPRQKNRIIASIREKFIIYSRILYSLLTAKVKK